MLGVLLKPMIWEWGEASEAAYDSLSGRLELWDRALLMLRDLPFTGVGPGQFSLVLHRWYEPLVLPPATYVPHAHNVLLQLALDLGVLGMAATLALGGTVVASAVRAAHSPLRRLIAIGVSAGFVGFFAYGMTDAIAIGARGALPIWALLGLGMAIDHLTRMARADGIDKGANVGMLRCD
jgi:putative inorganic carbon (HCO3(-)) transporter